MLPDLSQIETLFDVSFETVVIDSEEMAYQTMAQYSKNRPDFIIGGDIACDAATQNGIPSLFYNSSSESIHAALKEAERLAFAMEVQRQSTAQLQTILEASWNGILRINSTCVISMANQMAVDLIGVPRDTAVGQNLFEFLPQIDENLIHEVLSGTKDTVTAFVTIGGKSYVMLVFPIRSGEALEGAVLSFRSIETLSPAPTSQQEMVRSGYRTNTRLSDLKTENPQVRTVFEKAGVYALSSHPILIYENTGTRGGLLARCIHNSSPRQGGPFVSVDLLNVAPEDQIRVLFNRTASFAEEAFLSERDEPGAMVKADGGTLLIRHSDLLSMRAQSLILRTLLPWMFMHNDALSVDILDVRLIFLTERDLGLMTHDGLFLKDLYYRISSLPLRLPPLDQTPEDIVMFFSNVEILISNN